MTTTSTDQAVVTELLRLEEERCKALSGGDQATINRMMAPDLHYVHSSGKIETKADYAPWNRPRQTKREGLKVSVYGDTAVMTGRQISTADGTPPADLIVLQIWVKNPSGWQVAAFQGTKNPAS